MPSEQLRLKARIRWYMAAEMSGPSPLPDTFNSGVQPSFSVAGDLIMSRVHRADGGQHMHPGEELDVFIDLAYGQHYWEHIYPGLAFKLTVGGRVIANGSVIDVLV